MADTAEPLTKRPRTEEIRGSDTTPTPTVTHAALVTRPRQGGRVGKRVPAMSNLFEMRVDPQTSFFSYEAKIKERGGREDDLVGLTKGILQSVLQQMRERFGGKSIAVYPPNLVISPYKLKNPDTGETDNEMNLVVDVPKPNERKRREFEISLRLTKEPVIFGTFYDDYRRQPLEKFNEMCALRTSMNVIFHAGPLERFVASKGAWHYTDTDKWSLTKSSEMLRGFTQSTVDARDGMLLTFNSGAGCFWKHMPLDTFLRECGAINFSKFQGGDLLEAKKADRFIKKEKLKGVQPHIKKKRMPETIKGLAFNDKGDLMKVKDVTFLSKDAVRLLKRMQRLAKDDNDGARCDEISLETLNAALESLHERNTLKQNPPSETRVQELFNSLPNTNGKVDIRSMVAALLPPLHMVKYFADEYKMHLEPEVPVVWTGTPKNKSYHSILLVWVAPGQRKNKMNGMETQEMIKQTSEKPFQRQTRIKRLKEEADYNNDETLRAFNIQVAPEPVVVKNARILPPPLIRATDKGPPVPMRQGGDWDHRSSLFRPIEGLLCWAILVADTNSFQQHHPDQFCNELSRVCREKGIRLERPLVKPLQHGSVEQHMRLLKEEAEQSGKPLQLIVVFKGPDNTNGVTYAEIKRIGDIELGVPTTCCNSKKAFGAKGPMFQFPYVKGVALKINAKLGCFSPPNPDFKMGASINWRVEIPWKCKTMVFGIDVSHPSPGSRQPSVSAVTALMDDGGHRYICRYKAHGRRMEVGGLNTDTLAEMVTEMLDEFANANQGPPDSILVYRDGVSESQLEQVKQVEVAAFHQVARDLSTGKWCALLNGAPWMPKITYVVCQKRNQVRFTPINGQGASRNGNFEAGLVVDEQVVSATLFDFHLISHSGLQGTSRPVHYFVLEDDMGYEADEIEQITYGLCYGYSRCTKSVGCVTPVYYADKVAERVRMYYGDGEDLLSDSGTARTSGSAEDKEREQRLIHSNLCRSMFWL